MTTAFGASDAEGGWTWRDAYDAIEAATVLQIRRLGPQVARLEDAPAEIAALLAGVSALGLTHSRRSEEQVALDQFSTPPQLAALAVLAAQVRPADRVLEPSAGTGLLAVVAEACGASLTLNELAPTRAALLDGLFAGLTRRRHDGRHLADLLEDAGSFDVVVCNPPFSDLQAHLIASLKVLADGGRMAAIVPLTALADTDLRRELERHGVMVAAVAFPARAFAKHGTSVETGLLVMDRGGTAVCDGLLHQPEDLEATARILARLPDRGTARPRVRLTLDAAAFLSPRERGLALPIHLMEAVEDDDGNVTMVPVMDEGRPAVSQEALVLREALIERMACLPAVPGVLDALLEAFGTDAVAEITGRSRRVVVRDGRRLVERRGASAARAETDAFMSGRKRVLIFSDAGGTGRSYHADLSAPNQQRRVHYLVEPGWRADAAIQGLGRSHRTHQASAPLFRPVTTDIQGEKRFTSTIARRLDSLGALTRGERRTAGAGLFRAEDNLESPWARRALLVFYGALAFGELDSMTLETFMARTSLRLLDDDGGLKPSDDLPPIHTFLNRLLALRIADQNALFADFDRILSGILERAAASGDLDRGLEDIEAEALEVTDQETIRTDVSTGAETALVTFSLKVRREILVSDDALTWAEDVAHQLVINEKSGRAAIAELGLTTSTEENRLITAVRLVRPDDRQTMPEKTFAESAWKPADKSDWCRVWDEEVARTDPWRTRELTLATGLLLPIWGRLPARGCSVRRVRAPDGAAGWGGCWTPSRPSRSRRALA